VPRGVGQFPLSRPPPSNPTEYLPYSYQFGDLAALAPPRLVSSTLTPSCEPFNKFSMYLYQVGEPAFPTTYLVTVYQFGHRTTPSTPVTGSRIFGTSPLTNYIIRSWLYMWTYIYERYPPHSQSVFMGRYVYYRSHLCCSSMRCHALLSISLCYPVQGCDCRGLRLLWIYPRRRHFHAAPPERSFISAIQARRSLHVSTTDLSTYAVGARLLSCCLYACPHVYELACVFMFLCMYVCPCACILL